MTRRHSHQGPPALLHSMTEWRALLEMGVLPYALPVLMTAPRGDGHPVLLLPGFMADEGTLFALKQYLSWRGYAVQSWGFGRNVGFQRRHVLALEQKVRHMHHASGGAKVSLVGWSLGGLFALHCAHAVPQCVRNVITLGSPVSIDAERGSMAPRLVQRLYRMVAHPMGPDAHSMMPMARKLRGGQLPPVPVSCLYSEGDGVVPPQEATVDGDPALHENIRVFGSHTGLGFNAMVLWIVADRLAQPEVGRQPYRHSAVAAWLMRMLGPEPGAAH